MVQKVTGYGVNYLPVVSTRKTKTHRLGSTVTLAAFFSCLKKKKKTTSLKIPGSSFNRFTTLIAYLLFYLFHRQPRLLSQGHGHTRHSIAIPFLRVYLREDESPAKGS